MKQTLYKDIANFIKAQFLVQEFVPLHAPLFIGNERKYVMDALDSTFVSSVGEYVNRFEKMMCDLTGASYAIAIVNGTNALHMALVLAGVNKHDEVISQSLTFVATCNAIKYLDASPVFIDIDKDSLGLSPISLKKYLESNAQIKDDGFAYNVNTGKRIKACVPMHTFGLPCRIDEIAQICADWNIILIEDAAESIGSYYKGKHTGIFGKMGVFSFNGNKTITCGGGGALITNDKEIATRAKHLTTQAKVPHAWAFVHDEIGYNYRMPNLNAALACAQLEQLDKFVNNKRLLAAAYHKKFEEIGVEYCAEILNAQSNYWLNAILVNSKAEREEFLAYMNGHGIMTRPVWELMHRLPMFNNAEHDDLTNSEWIADRLVNIPSSVNL